MIDRANLYLVTPNFGADKSVFKHLLGFVFCVHVRSRAKEHDQRERSVIPEKINAVFASKSHVESHRLSNFPALDLAPTRRFFGLATERAERARCIDVEGYNRGPGADDDVC